MTLMPWSCSSTASTSRASSRWRLGAILADCISDLRVFVNGFNLLTFCNSLLKDADPEREERDWGASLAYPLMKSYNIGLNINF